MDETTKLKLEEFIETLEGFRGRATELITVYVPAGYDVNSVQKQLEAERSTAKNIKSTSTRKNVLDSLEKIIRRLKESKKNPPNGLALFAGNVSDVEGQQDIQLWEIEPPEPLNMRLYRCDKEFVLDALREMLGVSEIYGLLVMDRKEATIGVLEGKKVNVIQKMTSGVPSKIRAGGQCLAEDSWVNLGNKNRYLRDLRINDKILSLDFKSNKLIFTKVNKRWGVIKNKVLEIVLEDECSIICSLDHIFFVKNKETIKEVFAEDLRKGDVLICSNNHDILNLEIKEIIENVGEFKLIDIETEIGNFFANGTLVHNSSQRFHRITEGLVKEFYRRIAEEVKNAFFDNKRVKGIIVGGPIPTKDEFLEGGYLQTQLQDKVIGAVDIGDADESGLGELVEKSQDLLSQQEIIYEKKLLTKFFETLGKNPKLAAYREEAVRHALQYGAVETLILSKSVDKTLSRELIKLAENIGSKIEVVSTDTTEGEQFFNLSGIGALLRFGVN